MEMVFVPAGSFLMGSDVDDTITDRTDFPKHEVFLDAFWIDKTKVTNAQYAAFLTEKGNQEQEGAPWVEIEDDDFMIEQVENSFQPRNGFEDYPVIKVSWYGAAAYCDWVDGRLPTEAEWEYATRGPDSNRYPWGSAEPTCSLAEYTGCGDGMVTVGSHPDGASWVGALGLGSNVLEWVNDWYDTDYYANSPTENPQGPNTGELKGIRGASWKDFPLAVDASHRNGYDPTPPFYSITDIGFRCAVSHSE
jgi:formylglycine-generating enzyme required for sulfatase activity